MQQQQITIILFQTRDAAQRTDREREEKRRREAKGQDFDGEKVEKQIRQGKKEDDRKMNAIW